MATMHTPPIDLYDESQDDREEKDVQTSPRENGDLDQPALDAGKERLEQVLGW